MVFRDTERAEQRLVFYNMLLIKNLKLEEHDFIHYKKMCQSRGLGEKVVCQTLRGPH